MIETLKKYDHLFCRNHSHGDETLDEVFAFFDRKSKLILSAPHATASFTNKHEKCSDLYTGAITQYLGETENISTLIRMKFTPYKCLISDYIAKQTLQDHYFLDIHGFNKDIDYDICLGIGDCEEKNYPYLEELITVAKKYNLKYIVNHPDYCGKAGLTGRYQKAFNKPNVIQIELKKYLRDFYNYPDVVKKVTIPVLSEITKKYK